MCPPPNPALNITTAWALLCSAQSPVTQPTAFADQALFADDQHWAAGAQKILGSYFYCLARFTWPHLSEHPTRMPPFACDDFSEFKVRTSMPRRPDSKAEVRSFVAAWVDRPWNSGAASAGVTR